MTVWTLKRRIVDKYLVEIVISCLLIGNHVKEKCIVSKRLDNVESMPLGSQLDDARSALKRAEPQRQGATQAAAVDAWDVLSSYGGTGPRRAATR